MGSIEDETDLLQYGQQEQTEFAYHSLLNLQNDGSNKVLNDFPEGLYAFADA